MHDNNCNDTVCPTVVASFALLRSYFDTGVVFAIPASLHASEEPLPADRHEVARIRGN
jgi:hypothetical protein